MTEKNNCIFNISGGNIQILPNATQAVQNFYGDHYAEEAIKAGASNDEVITASQLTEEEKALLPYINNVAMLKQYTTRLSQCTTASDIGKVVVDMRKDKEIKVDEYEAARERFISVLLPLCPKVTSGLTISNVRQRINDAWDRRKR